MNALNQDDIRNLKMLLSSRNAELFTQREKLDLKIAHLKEYNSIGYAEWLKAERETVMAEIATNDALGKKLFDLYL